MTAPIQWQRVTRAQVEPVKLTHGDHIGSRNGAPVAYIVRQPSGRWVLWCKSIIDRMTWVEVLDRHTLRAAKISASQWLTV